MKNYYMNEIVQILEIAEQHQGSDIFLSLKMVMFDTKVNLNACQYTKEFLAEIAENVDEKYTCLPLVADVNMLINKQYKKLTHLQDKKTGDFKTTQIGAFYKFELNETSDGVTQLIGYARVPKRHKRVISALLELHKEGKLKFSYEIAVANYTVKDNVKHIDVDENNTIIGLAVVSMPACVSSSSLLVASLDNNLEKTFKGEKDMDENVIALKNLEDCKTFLTAELEAFQLRTKLINALPSYLASIFAENLEMVSYNFKIEFIFSSFVIVRDMHTSDYYKLVYTVENDGIQFKSFEKVTMEFVVPEVETFINKQNEKEKEELNNKVEELNKLVSEYENAMADKDSQIVTIGEKMAVLQAEIEALKPYKEKLEIIEIEKAEAEKQAQRDELKAKASKVLDEGELVEIAEAIENIDEVAVNAKIAAKYVALAEKETSKEKTIVIKNRITDSNVLEGKSSVFERE